MILYFGSFVANDSCVGLQLLAVDTEFYDMLETGLRIVVHQVPVGRWFR